MVLTFISVSDVGSVFASFNLRRFSSLSSIVSSFSSSFMDTAKLVVESLLANLSLDGVLTWFDDTCFTGERFFIVDLL